MPRDLPPDLQHPTYPSTLNKFTIPLKEFKTALTNPKVAFAAGGFIFRPPPVASESPNGASVDTSTGLDAGPQLLLLLRAPTDSWPNVWEPPGGGVDWEDESILHGMVREVWEETGLRVKRVRCQLWDRSVEEREALIAQGEGKEDGEVKFVGRRGDVWYKYNFLVDVISEKELGKETKEGEVQVDYDVVIDDQEHAAWGWYTKEQMEKLPFVSEQGKNIARQAFKAYERGD